MRWLYVLSLALLLVVAACGGDDGGDDGFVIETGTPTPSADSTQAADTPSDAPGEPLYVALGDSLSYGVAASDPDETSFVALVHDGFTIDIGLMNLGVPGYTSEELLNRGELDRGIAEIETRLNDDVEGNEVEAVTLEIGGNDLLDLYTELVLTGACVDVDDALDDPTCVSGLENAFAQFQTNLDFILERLRAADPDVPILLMTLYNPFSGRGDEVERVGDLALEGESGTAFETGLNDVIREAGPRYGTIMVEVFELFESGGQDLIAFDGIHPNDEGYALIADALLGAMSEAGLPVAAS